MRPARPTSQSFLRLHGRCFRVANVACSLGVSVCGASSTTQPNLDWLLLTKRPHLAARLAPWENGWPDNVWLGTTVEDQRWAEQATAETVPGFPRRYGSFHASPCSVPVELDPWLAHGDVQWVIAGGESGPQAHVPATRLWFLDLLKQCRRHEVPFPLQAVGRVGSNRGPQRIAAIGSGRRRLLRTARPFREEGERSQPRRKDLERNSSTDGTSAYPGQLII